MVDFHEAPRAATRDEVPVLDLSSLGSSAVPAGLASQLRDACVGTGFFYVANHGVSQAIIDNVFDATRRYFSFPLEDRLEDKMDDRFRRGFMPQGINQHPGFAPDLKESYEFMLDLPLERSRCAAGLAVARSEPLAGATSVVASGGRSVFRRDARARQAAAPRVRSEPRAGRKTSSCSFAASRWCRAGCSTIRRRSPDAVAECVRRRAAYRLRHDHAA